MRRPNLERLVEAYFPLTPASEPDLWFRYVLTLRDVIAPLIRVLLKERVITWYCFLLHDCPNAAGQSCVHVRLSPARGTTDADLRERLLGGDPIRRAGGVEVLTGVDASSVKGGVVEAWQLLGACSEFSLALIQAHPTATAQQLRSNVRQYVHFLCNQVQGQVLGICS